MKSATGSAYLAKLAVNSTHSYRSAMVDKKRSTCGRFKTYTRCVTPSISTPTLKSACSIT
ncbi:unnamed protein product [Schistosoma curassoni]|uniref:Uncharacterized protein n=1 Tax=Schistosoma curassoni TaxID=6186 RepID=A0A183KT68_9TREM|nr:unnamed protein product [Schistosoma curassoni]